MKPQSTRSQLLPPKPCFSMGIMSGTSVDSVDVSVVEITDERISLVEFVSEEYPRELRSKIKHAETLRDVSLLNREVGEFFSLVAKKAKTKVFCVGTHGQTIYHHTSHDPVKSTLQIGYPECLARDLGCLVVSDFRPRDIVLGGEGAPLTPYADLRFFGDKSPKLVLNIGGISNITVLGQGDVVGFDVGPGNAPLDRLTSLLTEGNQNYDVDGSLAAGGQVEEEILKSLIDEDQFIKRLPPKSTGVESYGDSFVGRLIELHGLSQNLLATVTEFVAHCIAEEAKKFEGNLILCGGGSQNSYLRSRISAKLGRSVELIDSYGVPWNARESMAFAVMAHDLLCGLDTSLTSVTGAKVSAPLGRITLP